MLNVRFFSVCLTSVFTCPAVFATNSNPSANDNVVVTANREPTKIPDVGSAFTIIDRELIDKRRPVFAADLLRDVPGVAVNRASTFGSQTQVRLRGAEANQVLVMIDGIKANDIAGADEFNFANLTSFDVERIEVIRGPQSALWGSDAMAGAINIITRRAHAPLDAGIFLEGGSFDSWNAGARIGTARERGNVNLISSWLDTDGTNISRAGDEKDGYRNWTTTLTAGYDVRDNLQFDLVGRYTDAANDFDDSTFGAPVDADNRTEQSQAYAQLRGRWSLFDAFWDQQLRMTWVDTDNKTYVNDTWDQSASGRKLGLYYQSDLNLTRDADGTVTNSLVLAVDFEDEEYRQRGVVSPFGDPNRDESMRNTGLVAEYLAKPLPAWALSFALRYDDNNEFKNIATWRATTSYRFDSTGTRLRASAGTGQKRPTFNERFGFFTNFIGNPELKPEQSIGWDIGIDQSLFADRITANLTYFNETLEDEINSFVFDPVRGGFTAENVDGDSDRKGIEAALRATLMTGLDLSASYTYTDSRQPDAIGVPVVEIRRPRHMAAANVNYRFFADRANMNLNVSYTGDQQDDNFSTFPATRVTLDAYTLVNLTAEYTLTANTTMYGRIDNLFDEDYENIYGYASPGVGIFAGVRMQFAN